MRKITLLFILVFAFNNFLKAQTVHQNTGWLFLMNTSKFNDKWGAHFDLQLRSSDEFNNLRNLLIRPGITYYFNGSNNLTVGYLFTQTYSPGAETITENRAWEQFIHTHKIQRVSVSHRFRLEQRFIEKIAADDAFAQRLRYFARFLIPLKRKLRFLRKAFLLPFRMKCFLTFKIRT